MVQYIQPPLLQVYLNLKHLTLPQAEPLTIPTTYLIPIPTNPPHLITCPPITPPRIPTILLDSNQSPTFHNIIDPNVPNNIVSSPQPSSYHTNLIASSSNTPFSSSSSHSSIQTSTVNLLPPSRIHSQNTHYMTTRAKDGIVQPMLHPTLLLTELESTSYKLALKDPR